MSHPKYIQPIVDRAEASGHHLVSLGREAFKCTSCDIRGFLEGTRQTDPKLGEIAFGAVCIPKRQSRKTRFHNWLSIVSGEDP